MSQIILVRHGQASLGKSNYDALSTLGFKQAALLGEYLNRHYDTPASIISGSLTRHQETASEIAKAFNGKVELVQDCDWNEFDFKKLIQLYLVMHPSEIPKDGDIRAFFGILKRSMLAWANNEIDCSTGELESWQAFSLRVNRALSTTIKKGLDTPQIVVSSGGSIAIKLMQILEISPKTMIKLNFQIRNTSFSELYATPEKIDLVTFNQINHLIEQKDKDLITYA